MFSFKKIAAQFAFSFLVLTLSISTFGPVRAETNFKPIETQFIASLAKPDAKSGNDAQTWGLWTVDPGPRGVALARYDELVANKGVAPKKWQFDSNDWWLEEHGLIMEPPVTGIAAGKYLVTGDRETKSVLTVYPKEADGSQRWELADGATIYDVTHLRCRAARYKPETANASCAPSSVRQSDFPMSPATVMPEVANCKKQDYAVLFIIGVEG
jgi:hypothetical protein